MGTLTPSDRPAPEGVKWDGTNDAEVLELVQRVADLHVWAPLERGALSARVNEPDTMHPGLSIIAGEDGGTKKWPTPAPIVVRVELGYTLVFDLFADTPLFVLNPDEFAAFYEGN